MRSLTWPMLVPFWAVWLALAWGFERGFVFASVLEGYHIIYIRT